MARMSSYAAMRGFKENADALFARAPLATSLQSPSASAAALSAPANDTVIGGKDYTSITELMGDFVRDRRRRVAETDTGNADIDFNAMNDDDLFKNLFDFLASGQINATINGVLIVAAEQMKELIANLLDMDEDGSDDPNAPQSVKDKKLAARLRERAEEQQKRQEEELEEHRAKWDAEMHDFGGGKQTGAQITQFYNWFAKKENQDKLRESMKRDGKTDAEIDDTFKKIEERRRLWMKMRDGTATPEERRRYEELGTPEVKIAEEKIKEQVNNVKNLNHTNEITNEDSKIRASTVTISVVERDRANADTDKAVEFGNGFARTSYANDHCKKDMRCKADFTASANPDATLSVPTHEVKQQVAVAQPKVSVQADTGFSIPS